MLARVVHHLGTVWLLFGLVALAFVYLLVLRDYGIAGLIATTSPVNVAHWLVLAMTVLPGSLLWWLAAWLERRRPVG